MVSKDKSGTQANHQIYQIRLEGHLHAGWSDWFDDQCNSQVDHETTLLTCTVVDQSALFGLLRKVRDLGLPLVSVTRVHPEQKTESKGETNDNK